MHQFPKRFPMSTLLPGFAAAVCLGITAVALDAAETPSLEGSCSGNGTVTFPSGGTESARCKASFKRQTDDKFAMNALCATPSGKVAQTAQLERIAGGRFTGEFQNPEYGITGQINIVVRGNSLSAALSGGGASASLKLSKLLVLRDLPPGRMASSLVNPTYTKRHQGRGLGQALHLAMTDLARHGEDCRVSTEQARPGLQEGKQRLQGRTSECPSS